MRQSRQKRYICNHLWTVKISRTRRIRRHPIFSILPSRLIFKVVHFESCHFNRAGDLRIGVRQAGLDTRPARCSGNVRSPEHRAGRGNAVRVPDRPDRLLLRGYLASSDFFAFTGRKNAARTGAGMRLSAPRTDFQMISLNRISSAWSSFARSNFSESAAPKAVG